MKKPYDPRAGYSYYEYLRDYLGLSDSEALERIADDRKNYRPTVKEQNGKR